ncbi:response regulator [Flaviaesturariibacter amylovorans]|uniref:Response regulator n=1 Tax=Flaviaesturariibacter amylovorans TaxID=1084520 RepID=A0ABP8GKB8_9BACT
MRQPTIFYAEDDLDDLYLFQLAFERVPDIRIRHFSNGAELLEALAATPEAELPRLIVLDLNMPQLDGRETLALLRQNAGYAAIPVLLFTTSNSVEDRSFAKQWNVDFLTKPILFEDLEALAVQLGDRCRF